MSDQIMGAIEQFHAGHLTFPDLLAHLTAVRWQPRTKHPYPEPDLHNEPFEEGTFEEVHKAHAGGLLTNEQFMQIVAARSAR